MNMQDDTLAYFCAVVDAGSIQAAARNVAIAPSALSRQIRILEHKVGVELFQRSPLGMLPTAGGLELYDFALRQATETNDMIKRIRSGGEDEFSEFRIACVEGVLNNLLPRWLASVRQRHTRIKFNVQTMGSADVASAVASGDVDVGYTFGSVARADLRELAAMPMPIRLALRRDHQLASEPAVNLEQLVGELCVVPDAHFGIRRDLDRACAKADINLQIAYETNSLAFALRLVQTARLITFTTSSMTVSSPESPVLIPLRGVEFNSSALTLVSHSLGSSARAGAIRLALTELMRDEWDYELPIS